MKSHRYDKALNDAIIHLFPVKTIVDIGCGRGEYIKCFLDNNINCIGYDGSPLTSELTKGLCQIKDFSEPVDIGKFELVLSLEVGEHIPVQYEQVFIDNLCRASIRYICVSWGIVGQNGLGHVNCKNNDYIIEEFKKRGFYYLEIESKQLREFSELSWFKNTIMVFKQNEN